MSKTVFAAAVSMAMGTSIAFAAPSYEDYARVTQVTPEYQRVSVPREECYSEVVPERQVIAAIRSPEPSSAGWPAVCSAHRSGMAMDE